MCDSWDLSWSIYGRAINKSPSSSFDVQHKNTNSNNNSCSSIVAHNHQAEKTIDFPLLTFFLFCYFQQSRGVVVKGSEVKWSVLPSHSLTFSQVLFFFETQEKKQIKLIIPVWEKLFNLVRDATVDAAAAEQCFSNQPTILFTTFLFCCIAKKLRVEKIVFILWQQ